MLLMHLLPAVLNGRELIKHTFKKFIRAITKKNFEITNQYKPSIAGEKC